ncbi:MAG: Cthe_2314 family HEPN domain-containing protein [Pedobacter sp.]|uniref:Cthe_2314 family HEPN domain-containing protein n=1 Tax=Pedobacter sp. TaxID=1411316 RepID=UPI00356761EF
MENHAFMNKMTAMGSQLLKDTDTGKKSTPGFSPNRELFRHEEYFYGCYLAVAEVYTILRQLDQSAVFLANFRSSKTLKEAKISRFEYIIYHLESHLLRMTGVLDRLLILVNQVLRMGLEDVSCKSHNMLVSKDNKKGKQTNKVEAIGGLFDALMEVSTFMDQFRDERNSVAHSKRINFEDLRRIEMYHIVYGDTTDPQILKWMFLIKRETDKKVWDYKAEMVKSNTTLKTLVGKVYDILDMQFTAHHSKLKS